MPELAEVEHYRKKWDFGIKQKIISVNTHPKSRIFRHTASSAFERALVGKTFVASHAHGKQMLFEFSGGMWLSLHLGMAGKLLTRPAGEPVEKHDHLVLEQSDYALVFNDYRMFGVVSLDETDGGFPDWWKELPVEVLSKQFTKKRVADFLQRHRKSPVKPLLLNQDRFPGIGNWMADEILWRMKLDPATRCGDLSPEQGDELWKLSRQVARDAMRVIAPDWKRPPNSWLFNHRWKDGGICPRKGCKTDLVRADLRGRTTCWCPTCQPAAV